MTTLTTRFTRREWLQLAAVGAAGYGASVLIRANVSVGLDVSTNPTARALLHERTGPSEGPADADLRVVVFTDYQCPACKKAAPELLAAVRRDGAIEVRYKDWPIMGARSQEAARVALAAHRQGLYPQVHHRLMGERRRLERPVLADVVEHAGGRWSRIEQDLEQDGAEIERALRRNHRDAFALGVPGTPAFLVGPLLIRGAVGRSQFTKAFAKARRRLAA